MAKIKTLYQNGQQIMPVTHPKAVMDENGISLDVVLAQPTHKDSFKFSHVSCLYFSFSMVSII